MAPVLLRITHARKLKEYIVGSHRVKLADVLLTVNV